MNRGTLRRSSSVAPFVALAALVALGSFGTGMVLATLTVSSATETGLGAANQEQPLTWFSPGTVAVDSIPSTVPPSAGASMTSPSILPTTTTSYTVGNATANHSAVRWDVTVKSAPVAIELEVGFTVVNLTSSVSHSFRVFVESPTSGITGPITVSFYLDMGTGAGGFRSATILSQQCTSYGSCP